LASQDEVRNIIHRSAGQVMRVFLCAVPAISSIITAVWEKRDLAIHVIRYSIPLLPFPKVHDDDEGRSITFNSLFLEKHISEFIILNTDSNWNRIAYLCCPQRMDIYVRYGIINILF
jgi:hypothetical protein